MGKRVLDVRPDKLRLAQPFRISGYVFEHWDAIAVTVREGGAEGRGEASGVYYTGDDGAHMLAEIARYRGLIEDGVSRADLQQLMPPGGARNALDCALWELEAQQTGRPVWALAGLDPPKPLITTFTLGAESPEAVGRGARADTDARAIKLKLTGDYDEDVARVAAVRAARPDVWLGVDANQGYRIADLDRLVAALVTHDVALLEQPLARGAEQDLDGYMSPIPIAADESALTLADLAGLVGRFDCVNIKLDKCGGLTEGLAMAREGRRLGLRVMVGNMVGTALAMAPGWLVGQCCDYVDLDGTSFLTPDRHSIGLYRDGMIDAAGLWGDPAKIAA
jgi:L-alanine-DL-glutamate epimerase-like enolase superfamily enzyme